jgi:hypothetical protein
VDIVDCRAGRIGDSIPFVEELAYQDFAPYSYMDGFWGDEATRGDNNKRASAIQEGDSRTLEVILPQGCVTSGCAMQAKSLLLLPVDEATLKFKCAHSITTTFRWYAITEIHFGHSLQIEIWSKL